MGARRLPKIATVWALGDEIGRGTFDTTLTSKGSQGEPQEFVSFDWRAPAFGERSGLRLPEHRPPQNRSAVFCSAVHRTSEYGVLGGR